MNRQNARRIAEPVMVTSDDLRSLEEDTVKAFAKWMKNPRSTKLEKRSAGARWCPVDWPEWKPGEFYRLVNHSIVVEEQDGYLWRADDRWLFTTHSSAHLEPGAQWVRAMFWSNEEEAQ